MKPMKAISVKQPWANMIASGAKTVETRTWTTDYRGDLIITSARRPDIEPAGYAIAMATLTNCRPMTDQDEPDACCPCYPGAFAWTLENIRRITPFRVRGRLGLFDVTIPDSPQAPAFNLQLFE